MSYTGGVAKYIDSVSWDAWSYADSVPWEDNITGDIDFDAGRGDGDQVLAMVHGTTNNPSISVSNLQNGTYKITNFDFITGNITATLANQNTVNGTLNFSLDLSNNSLDTVGDGYDRKRTGMLLIENENPAPTCTNSGHACCPSCSGTAYAALDATCPTGQVCCDACGSTGNIIRVNCGGGNYTDSGGNIWLSDYGYNTGEILSRTNAIANTNDDTLYQSERWDRSTAPELEYSFNVADGDYTVKLLFAEITGKTVGQRVFDVSIENILVIDDLDIAQTVGQDTALTEAHNITVTDGQINIQFIHGVENPKISAIEIMPATSPRYCHRYTPTDPVQAGYGSAYNLGQNNPSELLVRTACNTNSVNLDVGNGNANMLVYRQGHIYDGSNWQSVTLSGANQPYTGWYAGNAGAANIPVTNMSTINYIVAYTCYWNGQSWRCGCADSACIDPCPGSVCGGKTGGLWQLQAFSN